ncbi:MAG: acyltransferase family protein [Candidatus Methylumidiphilus sp.]
MSVVTQISAIQPAHRQDRLYYLDALRGTAIIFIVWLHASTYAHHEVSLPAARILLRLVDPGVAFFFLADGFLFARHLSRCQGFQYAAYMRKSAWRLLLPWLVFTMAYCLLRAGFEYAGFFTTYLFIGRSFTDILTFFFLISFQMYFLMSLFFIRTLSPFTRHLVVKGRWLAALSATVAYILILKFNNFQLGSDSVTSAIAGFQYYLLGILYFHLDGVFRQRASFIAIACILVYAILVVLEFRELLPVRVEILTKLVAMTANYAFYMVLVRRIGILVKLGQHTMEVYLLHAPLLVFAVAMVAKRVVSDPLVLHLVVTAFSLFGALAAAWFISRVPRGRIIFGESI